MGGNEPGKEESSAQKNEALEKEVAHLRLQLAEKQALLEALQAGEKASRNKETQLRQIIDLVPHMIFVKDWEGRYLLVNKAHMNYYGTSVEEITGRFHADIHGDSEELKKMLRDDRDVMTSGVMKVIPEEIFTIASGEKVILRTTKVPFFPIEGNTRAVLGIAIDITEQKNTEEKIKASLKEKEILLKEIHHRVKNNLQAVSSLLSLQASKALEPRQKEACNLIKNRIKAMALVHEKLFTLENIAYVEFGEHARSIVHELVLAYGSDETLVEIGVEKITVELEKAVPLSLILNELVSNALIHAFPGRSAGTLRIDLHRSGDGRVSLAIQDDGKGFPAEFDIHDAPTLGLTLIRALVDQIDGTMEMRRDNGTAFIITYRETG